MFHRQGYSITVPFSFYLLEARRGLGILPVLTGAS